MKILLFATTLLSFTCQIGFSSSFLNLIAIDSCPDKNSNLIVNGDFEQGYYGFTSDFGRGVRNATKNGCTTQGWFVITKTDVEAAPECQNYPFLLSLLYGAPNTKTSNNPNDISNTSVVDGSSCSYGFRDHTTGSGNYFGVDPDAVVGRAYWKQTISICPYTDYNLSFWVRNLSNNPNLPAPKLHFEVDGKIVNPATTYTKTAWVNSTAVWNSGTSSGNVLIKLVNDQAGCDGNDAAIDDIYFGACTSVDLTCDSIIKLCSNEKKTVRFSAKNMGYIKPVFQWQKLDSTTSIWNNILGAQDSFYVININNNAVNQLNETYRVRSAPLGGLNSSCEKQSNKIKITVLPSPNTKAIITNATCSQNNGQISISVQNGTLPYNVKWQNNSSLLTQALLSDGKYTVTVTDKDNCVATDSFVVTKTFRPILNATIQFEFCGQKNGSVTLTSAPKNKFSFNNSGFIAQNIYSGLSAATYTVRAIDTLQCDTSFSVTVPNKSTLSGFKWANLKNETCHQNDGEVTLNIIAQNPVSFSNNGLIYQDSKVFKNLKARKYKFYVRDTSNCQDSFALEVINQGELKLFSLATDAEFCNSGNGAVYFNWTGGTGKVRYSFDSLNFISGGVAKSLKAGKYKVYYRDSTCTLSDSFSVGAIFRAPLKFDVLKKATDCNDSTGILYIQNVQGGTPPFTYSINDSLHYKTNAYFDKLKKNTYTLFVRDSTQCPSTIHADTINAVGCTVYCPTAFSPNGDNINDAYQIFAAPGLVKTITRFQIYNSVGKMVYNGAPAPFENFSGWWYGTTFSGDPEPAGVYVYVLEVEYTDATTEKISGSFVLMR